jgi:hypothetical protein
MLYARVFRIVFKKSGELKYAPKLANPTHLVGLNRLCKKVPEMDILWKAMSTPGSGRYAKNRSQMTPGRYISRYILSRFMAFQHLLYQGRALLVFMPRISM